MSYTKSTVATVTGNKLLSMISIGTNVYSIYANTGSLYRNSSTFASFSTDLMYMLGTNTTQTTIYMLGTNTSMNNNRMYAVNVSTGAIQSISIPITTPLGFGTFFDTIASGKFYIDSNNNFYIPYHNTGINRSYIFKYSLSGTTLTFVSTYGPFSSIVGSIKTLVSNDNGTTFYTICTTVGEDFNKIFKLIPGVSPSITEIEYVNSGIYSTDDLVLANVLDRSGDNLYILYGDGANIAIARVPVGAGYTPPLTPTSFLALSVTYQFSPALSYSSSNFYVGAYSYSFTYTNSFIVFAKNPMCFAEGTQILCYENEEETYKPIESLYSGDLVKTLKHGYKPLSLIAKDSIHNPSHSRRVKHSLYKLSSDKYPEITQDLFITGNHAILVDSLTPTQEEQIIDDCGKIFVTDDKYRLSAYLDERAEPHSEEKEFTVYNFSLEGDDPFQNYGVWANGLLVETTYDAGILFSQDMEVVLEKKEDFERIQKVMEKHFNSKILKIE